MKKQLAMVIDAGKCIDCKACMASCKVANQVPEGEWRNWIVDQDLEKAAAAKKPVVFQPGGCMHCSKPTCVSACPTGATYRSDKDGSVLIDQGLCIGCGQCLGACPYGARFRHPEKRVADKCDYCQTRRSQGLEPACVTTCPTKARSFGDIKDPGSEVAKLLKRTKPMQVVNQKTPTDPNMYYLGDPGNTEWPVEAQMPTAFEFWRNLAGPGVKLLAGLSGLGVLAMLGKQLVMRGDAPPEEQGGGHD